MSQPYRARFICPGISSEAFFSHISLLWTFGWLLWYYFGKISAYALMLHCFCLATVVKVVLYSSFHVLSGVFVVNLWSLSFRVVVGG
jgi:hypothetical protein